MTNEQLRLQMLSGIITEGEYKAKLKESKSTKQKDPLNENFVGTQMVGNIFDREKTDYELAFEHFTKGSLSENEEVEENISNNLTLLKNLFTKVEDLRLEMINMDLNPDEPNYEIIYDFVETDGENAFNILLNGLDSVISEID